MKSDKNLLLGILEMRQRTRWFKGELGICQAAVETSMDGINSGRNGGRICWAVAGTLCNNEVQSIFAIKIEDCVNCAFHQLVLGEEENFVIHPIQVQHRIEGGEMEYGES